MFMKKLFILILSLVIPVVLYGCSTIFKSADTDNIPGISTPTAVLENTGTDTIEEKSVNVRLYFPTIDNGKILAEEREVTVKGGAILKSALEALIKGPDSYELRKAIPEGTKILSIKKEGTTAVVDFSKEYDKATGQDEETERVSIVNTLTNISGVDKVRIMVEGKDITASNGKPFGDLAKVSLDSSGRLLKGGEKMITLYFSDQQAEALIAEQRNVQVGSGEKLEQIIFEELKKGSETGGLVAVIPRGTELLSVETENAICYLNLSREFVDYSLGSAGEVMTLFSIVNSLTELPNVDKVQFLIEGRISEVYIHSALDTPYERNTSLIKAQ